jgi:PAS domain S-box-containing protein
LDAQRRFQLVFQRFIAVFARPEHPLTLFLDDLQWLDAATLDLLEDLLSRQDVQYMMLIGAYRDNEVDSAHPLTRRLEAIRKAGAIVQEIALAPLACEDLEQLIADSLHCEPERATSLAQLVQEKTAGNPFFANQFIYSLADEALLIFDHCNARWSWDLNRIHAKGYTDNVVDLMVGKLTRLPVGTQNALQQLACLGNSADFALLAKIYGESTDVVHRDLLEAVRVGLVLHSKSAYRFLHDRVQEAAYSQIPETARAEAHIRIGRLLAAGIPPTQIEEKIFDVVNQLNRGSHLITSDQEREWVAELNLVAGRRAKISTAYTSALSYLAVGRALLTEQIWDYNYELIFAIEYLTAECELLTASKVAAENRLSMLARRAKSGPDSAAVTRLRLTLYTTLDQSDRGVEICLEYLQRGGVDWSLHPTSIEVQREYDRIWSQLGSRQIEELVDLPLMSNPDLLATQDILVEFPAMHIEENLSSLVVCRMVNLSLEYGNSDASCFAYVWFAQIAGPRFGNYQDGFRFGRLGYELVEKRGLKRYQARTYMSFGNIVMPWARHVLEGRDLVRRAFATADRTGDITFASYSCNHLITNFLAAGDPLAEVEREAERGFEYAQKVRFGFVIDNLTMQLGFIRTLRGLTPTFGSFNYEGFDELRFERHLAGNPVLKLLEFRYWVRKLQARFFAADYASAMDASLRAQQLLWTSPSHFETAEYCFYSALGHAAAWNSASPDEKQQHFEALVACSRQLELWARHCPENFENRAALVSAEITRIEGRERDAAYLYEYAIRSAHANNFVHNEALANELAARFYAALGFDKIALTYLRDARYYYLRWGADGKVRQLEGLYPHLRHEKPLHDPTSTILTSVEHLDLATVIKLSQAISGEILPERLIDTLMRTALEQAGAERGLLIFSRGAEQRIAAEATIEGDLVTVHLRDKDVAATVLPESVLHYVLRTRESVILDDASSHNPFSADPYIVESYLRSILCLPLINQGKLTGILYLENNLTPRVFTPGRVALLKVLASQAAISLENSRLYRDVADREGKIRRLVDANIIGIFIADREGRIFEANDAFLRVVGYDREDLVSGRVRWTELSPPEWRERDVLIQAELSSTGVVQPFEKEYFRKDGSRVPVLIGAAMFKEGGDKRLAFVLDLTERKRAEEALRESERSLRSAIDGIPGLVAILTPKGDLEAVNRQIFEYCGQSLEELRNWGTNGTIHPDDLPHLAEVFAKSIAAGIPYGTEARVRRFDGEFRWFEIRGIPVRDASDRIVRWYSLLTDTEDRTQALARLQQMQLDFAHTNRVSMMGELAASLSHEIAQPIASARNNARAAENFLKMQPPELGEVREALSCVVGDADRAGEIIDRIREQIKKAPPRKECFDLNVAIKEVIVLARSVTLRNGISVQTWLAEGLLSVLGDRVQLQQVLLNLILNAAEAMGSMEEGARELLISTEEDQAGVVVAVHDSGPGIEPDRLERVFEAFYTTKPSGTGMGLSICRSIIHAHGGKLWAEANEPRGAVFQFTLPGAERELTTPPQASLPT